MKRRVEIVIDELVLHGFKPADRYAIGEALSAELELLANHAAAELNFGAHDFIDAGKISLHPNARPEAVGAQVGRAVFTGLSARTENLPKQP